MSHRLTAGVLITALFTCALPGHAAPAAAAAQPTVSVQDQRDAQLRQLADDYYQALARFEPLDATDSGDNRFDDQLGISIAPALRAQQFARYRGYLQRLHAIARARLKRADRIDYDVLAFDLHSALALGAFPEHLLPMLSLPQFHQVVLGDGTVPLNLLETNVARWIARQR